MQLDIPSSRVLTLHGPAVEQEGVPPLEVLRLEGHEAINELFEYRLWVQTPELLPGAAPWEIDEGLLLGRELSVHLELDAQVGDGAGEWNDVEPGTRQINGIVSEVSQLDASARHRQLQLVLRPGLWEATLGANHHAFHDRSALEVLDAVLGHYPWPVDKRLIETYGALERVSQRGESNWHFCCRVMQQCGINHHFEHAGGTHRLVLSDHNGAFRPYDDSSPIPIHHPGHRPGREYLHSFIPQRSLTARSWEGRDHDYSRPRREMVARQGDAPEEETHPRREVFQWRAAGDNAASNGASHSASNGAMWSQPNAGRDPQANTRADTTARWLARIRHEELLQTAERAQGQGHIRSLVPGHSFHLQGHSHGPANTEHLILRADLRVIAPGQESQAPTAQDPGGHWHIDCHFTTQPARTPLRPALTLAKPRIAGPEPGLVVGPEPGQIHTDEGGRIKVWLPWQRRERQEPAASLWMRVAHPWAGNQQGLAALPRVGQEVAVDYYGGDPDLPFVSASVHNALNPPGWQLPGQHALTGLRSRELGPGGGNSAAGRSNHLVLDDTPGHLQAQLKSDHQHSSLSLGDVHRIEDREGRKDARGQGLEARTDGHGVVRAAKGLLLTTEPRPAARAHMLDSAETQDRLQRATTQHSDLADLARQNQAQEAGDQDEVYQQARAQQQDIAGSGEPLGELTQPHLVLASAAGVTSTAAGSTHQASGGHHVVTSAGHTSVSAGGNLLASVRGAVRIFAARLGMRLIAAAGDVDIRALTHSINLLAQLEITEMAETIRIRATKNLELSGGNSYARLASEGIEIGSPGAIHLRPKTLSITGPANVPVPDLPVGLVQEGEPGRLTIDLGQQVGGSHSLAGEPYEVLKAGAVIGHGVADEQGRILIADHVPGTPSYTVRLIGGAEFDVPVTPGPEPTARLAQRGYRAQDDTTSRNEGHGLNANPAA